MEEKPISIGSNLLAMHYFQVRNSDSLKAQSYLRWNRQVVWPAPYPTKVGSRLEPVRGKGINGAARICACCLTGANVSMLWQPELGLHDSRLWIRPNGHISTPTNHPHSGPSYLPEHPRVPLSLQPFPFPG